MAGALGVLLWATIGMVKQIQLHVYVYSAYTRWIDLILGNPR